MTHKDCPLWRLKRKLLYLPRRYSLLYPYEEDIEDEEPTTRGKILIIMRRSTMRIKIYQINLKRDANRVAFVGTDRLEKYQGSAEVDSTIYDEVFEGEVDCAGLEDVYRMFNLNHPEGYTGRSLSVSDVVEVVNGIGNSTFHFCDTFGFKTIAFKSEFTDMEKAGDEGVCK